MRDEKIILAELDIDVKSLMESQKKLEAQLHQLTDAKTKLQLAGKASSKEFKELDKTIVSLNSKYEIQAATLVKQLEINEDLIKNQQLLDSALKKTNVTETEYIKNNEALIKLKNELNVNSSNYEKNLALINIKLQENNIALKESGSAFSGYKSMVAEGLSQISLFNGGLQGLGERAEEAGGMKSLFAGAFSGISAGIKGMGAAISANPIGVLLQIIGPIIEQFKKFTPLTNAVEQAMAALSPVINLVTAPLKLLGQGLTFVVSGLTSLVSSMSESANEAINLKKAQQELADEMKNQEVLNEKAKNNIDDKIQKSKDLTLSEDQRLEALQQAFNIETDNFNQRKAQADETYNLAVKAIAQDNSLTAEELKNLTEKGFAYAQEYATKKGLTEDELDMLRSAETERTKIYGDEQKITQKHTDELAAMQAKFLADKEAKEAQAAAKAEARRKEAQQKEKQRIADAIERQKLELDQFIATQGQKADTLAEEIKLAEDIAVQKEKIAQAEFNASDKSANDLLKLEIAKQDTITEKLKAQAEATETYAKAEYALWESQNQSKLTGETALTDALIAEEGKRLDAVKAHKLELLALEHGTSEEIIAQKRANNEQLSLEDMAYLTGKQAIDEEYKTNNENLDKAAKDQKNADKQKEYELALAEADTKYEEDMINEQMRYDAEVAKLDERKAKGLISEQEYNTLIEAENKRSAENKKAIDKAVVDNKLQLASANLSNIIALVGKESAAGKAAAIAQTTIDTYKSAMSAYSGMTSAIPGPVGIAAGIVAAAASVAMGIANVKKIASTKTPKAEKGALFNIGGNRHSAGGTMFRGEDGTAFEAEQGELIGVMNRNAAQHFMAFNNAYPSGAGAAPNYFASGGIVAREMVQPSLNTDELAGKIAHANRSIPAPVVSVQDIVTEGNSYVQVQQGADF